ncbi:hypothetical protein KI659_06820 [Litoribacter alkaliphilus]|uniref:Uncharacterized protein n=1 Tax=Litoribacter ruber TaxID=702568 RepID=A0AAP2G3R0_9BACT|nr:hypothetical protein [Litoribacter alkaliphilus]MBS9523730.1 hypothetical protein [Litoribacter alkaliphilus]
MENWKLGMGNKENNKITTENRRLSKISSGASQSHRGVHSLKQSKCKRRSFSQTCPEQRSESGGSKGRNRIRLQAGHSFSLSIIAVSMVRMRYGLGMDKLHIWANGNWEET